MGAATERIGSLLDDSTNRFSLACWDENSLIVLTRWRARLGNIQALVAVGWKAARSDATIEDALRRILTHPLLRLQVITLRCHGNEAFTDCCVVSDPFHGCHHEGKKNNFEISGVRWDNKRWWWREMRSLLWKLLANIVITAWGLFFNECTTVLLCHRATGHLSRAHGSDKRT